MSQVHFVADKVFPDPVRSRPERIEISRDEAAQIVFACQSSAADDLIRKLITIHGVLPVHSC